MTTLLFASLRPLSFRGLVFFTLMGLVLLLWQNAIQPWLDPVGYGPDLFLVWVLYFGLNAPLASGAAIVTLLGFLNDAAGGRLFGLSPLIFMIIMFICHAVRQKIDPIPPWYLILFILGFVIVANGLTWLFLHILDKSFPLTPESFTSPTVVFFISAVMTSLVGPLLFYMMDVFRFISGIQEEKEP